MPVMDDLRQIRWLSMELSRLQEQLQINVELGGYHAPVLRNCPSYGGGGGDAIGAYVVRTDALREQVERRAAEIEARIQAVQGALAALPVHQRLVMELRYVDGLDWHGVASGVAQSIRWCQKRHAEAARAIELRQ